MSKLTVSMIVDEKISAVSAAERKVARILLADYPTAGLQPIAKLAAASNVSGPTVLRFVKKIGFEGYQDFQGALLNELSERKTSFLDLYDKRKTGLKDHQLLTYHIEAYQKLLAASLANMPVSEFDYAVQQLVDTKKRVMCVGGRFSDSLARYLTQHLYELRAGVRFAENVHTWRFEQLLDISSRDIIVVFDFRRYQQDTVDFAVKAKNKGATIILITDPLLSPIASVSKCVLPIEVDGPSAFDSCLPAVALIEALVAAVIETLGEEGRKRVRELEGLKIPFEYKENERG